MPSLRWHQLSNGTPQEVLRSNIWTRPAEISRHYKYGTRCTAKCKADTEFNLSIFFPSRALSLYNAKHAMTEWATMRRGSQGRKHGNIQQPHGVPYLVSFDICSHTYHKSQFTSEFLVWATQGCSVCSMPRPWIRHDAPRPSNRKEKMGLGG